MSREPLLRLTSSGLYCSRGGFHVDPWSPAARAVVTHAHGDHAVKGSRHYLTATSGRAILQHRMGPRANIQGLSFGETIDLNGVHVSLHPSGHILGSAQVRVEYQGEVWVVSGDYKVAPDRTCEAYEPVTCHTFITESTFGHSYFHWEPQSATFASIHDWWKENQSHGRASLLYAYSLGKAQRLLAGLNPEIGPIYAHPVVEEMNLLYRGSGVELPATCLPTGSSFAGDWSKALILMPPSARWASGLSFQGNYATAFASGWMVLPGQPGKRGVETGFALSDHADYDELLWAVAASRAERVFVTHGYIEEFIATLKSRGYDAQSHRTPRCKRPPVVANSTD